MSTYDDRRQAWADRTPFGLANDAGTIGPDATDSKGSEWLALVRDAAIECADWQRENDGTIDPWDDHEIVDGLVPIYTYPRWLVFADLGAWQEDLDGLGGMPDDMTTAAGYALYLIADRLVSAILSDLAEAHAADLADD